MIDTEGSTPPHTGAEHTAEHILMRSVQMTKGELKVKKVEFNRGGGMVFFESDDLTMEDILNAEKVCNKIIEEGRAVNTFFFDSLDEARRTFPDMRAYESRIQGKVRIIEIEGFDRAACAGEHASNTRECDYVLVTRVTRSGPTYRLDFAVGAQAREIALEMGKVCLSLTRIFGCTPDTLEKTALNVKNEVIDLRRRVHILTEDIASQIVPVTSLGDVSLYHLTLREADDATLHRYAKEITRGKRAVVFLLNITSGLQAILAGGEETGLDASLVMRDALNTFGGRGGGDVGLSVGSFPLEVKADLERRLMESIAQGLKGSNAQ